MRSSSLVFFLLVGALLSDAYAQHRRYVNDQDSENQIDSTGTPVEEPERHPHHNRHHHVRHHHFERTHHRGSHHRSGANVSQAEETMEFHYIFMKTARRLAEQSGLSREDVNTVLNIMEENRPPFKREDRSQWTEDQWARSKLECNQRKALIRALAFEQIRDQLHLTIFFDKLEAQKKLMIETVHKYIVGRLTRIAVESGLNDSQIEKVIREVESHKPVGVHWRPGMSENEKKRNQEIHVKNWQLIKEACLKDVSEVEQMQLNRYFAAVERDFSRQHRGGHRHHRRPHHHRRHHDQDFLPRESLREHHRRHHDSEAENTEPEVHRHHRRHRHHSVADEDSEEIPRPHHHRRHHRHHHHETEDEDQTPRRRHSEEVDDSEEHKHHHHHRHHHHHPRPHHIENSEESEERYEDAPKHHHRRHYRHHEEDSDNGDERRSEEFEPRHHHRHRHHRHHHTRQEDSENTEDSRVRPEPYRQYRRHARRGDGVDE